MLKLLTEEMLTVRYTIMTREFFSGPWLLFFYIFKLNKRCCTYTILHDRETHILLAAPDPKLMLGLQGTSGVGIRLPMGFLP